MAQAEERYEAIDKAVEACKLSGEQETIGLRKGGEVYAYKHPNGIAWGVNSETGVNIRRKAPCHRPREARPRA